MSLIDRIKSALGIKPRLRNKAGGYAWINARARNVPGAEILIGRAVKTVALTSGHMWRVDPPQHFVVTAPSKLATGRVVPAGTSVLVIGISDETLDPWKEDGVSDAEVRELYAPQIIKESERA